MNNNILKAYCMYVMNKSSVFVNLKTGEVNPDTGYMVLTGNSNTLRHDIPDAELDVMKLRNLVSMAKKHIKQDVFLSLEYLPASRNVGIDLWNYVDDLESASNLARSREMFEIWDNENKTIKYLIDENN
jgi:hypothetical protein